MKKISVLLVDDDDSFRKVMTIELGVMNFNAFAASTRDETLHILNKETVDVIILDIILPDLNGIDLLHELKSKYPEIEIIMLTAHGTVDSAIQSLKYGAYDYLTKPCKLDELEAIVKKAYEKRLLRNQNLMLKEQISRGKKFPHIIGESPMMRSVLDTVEKVARTQSTVLIQGESGVGKEVIARLIYQRSLRKDNPFVVIDCSTLHENLLESELFGHEKGAYTGAVALKRGLFEIANTGTIFLDEVGEIALSLQAKLLRVLETGTFRRLGGTRDITVDVRVVAATNKNPGSLVEKGLFREDLYYRLNVITITIPRLSERKQDIPLLVNHFLKNSKITGKTNKIMSDEALKVLIDYSWPGNVRELENVIERALIICDTDTIKPRDLPRNVFQFHDNSVHDSENEVLPLKVMERKYIRKILQFTGNNKLKASKLLGIDPKTLYRKLKPL